MVTIFFSANKNTNYSISQRKKKEKKKIKEAGFFMIGIFYHKFEGIFWLLKAIATLSIKIINFVTIVMYMQFYNGSFM